MTVEPWPQVLHGIGMLLPATNTAVEIELNRVLPRHFQLHIARVQVGSVDADGFAQQDKDIDYQSALLGTINPTVIILLQTSASFFSDGYDTAVTKRIQAASGAPAITTAQAMLQAFEALSAKRVALVSPYSDQVSRNAKRYIESGGQVEVASIEGLNVTDPGTITTLSSAPIDAALERAARTEPDVLVVAGGAFHGMRFIAGWEQTFERPVITTNQLAIWAALRAAGDTNPVRGFGRLLELGL